MIDKYKKLNIERFDATDEFLSRLPQVKPNVQYWLFKEDDGSYFDDFLKNNYIAVAVEKKAVIGSIQKLLDFFSFDFHRDIVRPKKNRVLSDANAKKVHEFEYLMKENDVVLISSQASDILAVGIIVSDAIVELDEKQIYLTNYKYLSRRKIKWRGTFFYNNIDPALKRIIEIEKTMTLISDYNSYINRELFDTYIEENMMHLSFYIGRKYGIDLDSLTSLLYSYNELAKILHPNKKIEIKINIQSPGLIEIIGGAMTVASITGIIYNNSNIKSVIKHGGKVGGLGFSLEWSNVKKGEWEIEKEKRQLEIEEEKHSMEKEKHEIEIIEKKIKTAEAIEEFCESLKKVDGQFPKEFVKAIEASVDADLAKKKGKKRSKKDKITDSFIG